MEAAAQKEEETGVVESDFSDDDFGGGEEEEEEEDDLQEPFSEMELEELITELLEVESKALEAQEALEEESLVKVEDEVRKELAQSLSGDELEKAVADEMLALKEEWEELLDELETEGAHLLEQLDGAGIEISSLCKWIESQVAAGCCTEAWKKRTHWIGTQISIDATESVAKAEEYLKTHRPVRRRHGKILEEGASGFLGKTIAKCNSTVAVNENIDIDWDTFNEMCSEGSSLKDITFDNKHWASVYLANTPQEAAELGLKFSGVNEVEEIGDVDGATRNPFVEAAIANERDLILTEEQKRNFRKIKEEDDANDDVKLRIRMKRRRRRRKQNKKAELVTIAMTREDDTIEDDNGHEKQIYVLSSDSDEEKTRKNYDVSVSNDLNELRGFQRLNKSLHNGEPSIAEVILSSSDSGSNDSDANKNARAITKRKKIKKIRRILDDTELGEETKTKIAIEKERQERLKSLEAWYSTSSKSVMVSNGLSYDGTRVEKLADNSSCYIINLLREEGEEAVSIPPSIAKKLKPHQIAGVRFMWENIVQSVKKVRAGDSGLGCILAHMMGLGKTFQVVAFLYTVMRSVDLGLKTALIVTPVSVQHNWRQEFNKWRPSELQALQIFMLEDVPREKRLDLLMNWRTKGGVLLIGYTAFRNLSLGKYMKDLDLAKDISHALQVGPDIVVCDEAHIIKNTRSDITQALKQVKCQRRIALTGSPLQNNLMEYHCMVDFVREGYLGSCHEFRNRFQNPIENGQHTNATAEDVKIMNQRSHILHEQLKGFVQRIDSCVVINDLPPKTVYVITVKLSSLQRKLYKKFLDVHGFRKDKASDEKKKSFFAGYQALSQIWNHPGILQLRKENKDPAGKYEDVEYCLADDSSSDENANCNLISGEKQHNPNKKLYKTFVNEDWWRDLFPDNNYNEVDFSGKMVLLLDILRMCSDMGDKALVFSQSLLTLDLIELYLSKLPRPTNSEKCWKKGWDWYRLDGGTESSERQKLVQRFNDPSNKRVKCTLISTRAGSLGINLYAANRVIIVDGSWNPTYDLQAIYRAWRYGQEKPVFAYRLLAHATMEEKIYKRQVTKEGLAARVVDKQQVHRTISKEEMLDLFDFGGDENADVVHESGQDQVLDKPNTTDGASGDMVMQSLISRYKSSWISSYHKHDTLLQENEDEKLSKEEQDLAWEIYRRGLNTTASHRLSPNEIKSDDPKVSFNPSTLKQHKSVVVNESALPPKPLHPTAKAPESNASAQAAPRKCTNLSHLLTLRSQGTKMGCSTFCGQCAQEIRWEDQ